MALDPTARILRRLARSSASSSELAELLGVSRQAVHRRLRSLAEGGLVVPQGAGSAARWALPSASRLTLSYAVRGLQEDLVYDDLERKVAGLRELGPAARSIAFYGFTEMLNNAIDHSGSSKVTVEVEASPRGASFTIRDRGRGVFANIQRHMSELATPLEALQELLKGKLTTMPERHTGEGIFFTSKAVGWFLLEANGVEWIVDNARHDQAARMVADVPGTRVVLRVPKAPERLLDAIFREFTDDLAFTRSSIVVRLFAIGVAFVSRSEARRLVNGLERFREVVLDFDRVESVGQGFADEVFRVFARAHPGTALVPRNMGAAVAFMVGRSLAAQGR